jgi:DNA processing protein
VRAGPSPAATDPLESAILSELGPEPVHIDSISRRTGRPSADVARALSILEVKGIVRCLGGTQWVANP